MYLGVELEVRVSCLCRPSRNRLSSANFVVLAQLRDFGDEVFGHPLARYRQMQRLKFSRQKHPTGNEWTQIIASAELQR